jgi:hypothetical protein
MLDNYTRTKAELLAILDKLQETLKQNKSSRDLKLLEYATQKL